MKDVKIDRFEKGPKADEIHFAGAPIKEPPAKEVVTPPLSKDKGEPARVRADADARKSEQPQTEKELAEEIINPDVIDAEVSEEESEAGLVLELRKAIKEGTVNNQGIRFSQQEADALRDVSYEVQTRYRFKVSKNDMIRLGLDYLIADYRRRGEDSVLIKFVVSKRDLV